MSEMGHCEEGLQYEDVWSVCVIGWGALASLYYHHCLWRMG